MLNLVSRLLARRWCAGAVFMWLLAMLAACGGARRAAAPHVPAADTLAAKLQFDTVSRRLARPLTEAERFQYDQYFLEAICQKQKARYDAELMLLDRALQLNPDADEAWYEKAIAWMAVGDGPATDSAACRMLERAVGLAPDNDDYKEQLANLYAASGQPDNAARLYEWMTQKSQPTSAMLYNLVELYERMGDFQQELRTLNRIEQAEGKTESTTVRKSFIYMQLGDTAQAYGEVRALSNRYADDNRYRLLLANFYLQGNRPADAYREIRQALQRDSVSDMGRALLLQYFQQQHDTAAYYAQLDTALAQRNMPDYAQVAVMARLVRDYENARLSRERFYGYADRVADQPQRSAELLTSCVAYLQAKKWPEDSVAPFVRKLLDFDPTDLNVRFSLIKYLVGNLRIKELAEVCHDGTVYHPDKLVFYYYESLALYDQGDEAGAIEVCQRGLERMEKTTDAALVGEAYTLLGNLYQSSGKRDLTYAAYDKALEYDDGNLLCLNNYAYYLAQEGRNLDKAEAMSRRTLEAEPDNVTYLDTYAWIMFAGKNYGIARTYIDKTLKLAEPTAENASLFEHAGDIYAKLGHTQQALTYWRQALSLTQEAAARKLIQKKINLKKYVAQ